MSVQRTQPLITCTCQQRGGEGYGLCYDRVDCRRFLYGPRTPSGPSPQDYSNTANFLCNSKNTQKKIKFASCPERVASENFYAWCCIYSLSEVPADSGGGGQRQTSPNLRARII